MTTFVYLTSSKKTKIKNHEKTIYVWDLSCFHLDCLHNPKTINWELLPVSAFSIIKATWVVVFSNSILAALQEKY